MLFPDFSDRVWNCHLVALLQPSNALIPDFDSDGVQELSHLSVLPQSIERLPDLVTESGIVTLVSPLQPSKANSRFQ